jgi:hypothetical protein
VLTLLVACNPTVIPTVTDASSAYGPLDGQTTTSGGVELLLDGEAAQFEPAATAVVVLFGTNRDMADVPATAVEAWAIDVPAVPHTTRLVIPDAPTGLVEYDATASNVSFWFHFELLDVDGDGKADWVSEQDGPPESFGSGEWPESVRFEIREFR